ncbi:uncharacterized protein LOC142333431 isoform X2 [Lycorma delicatula]|uniref:uncharacterized protein LOC142333431 isoform X2 n=1 Tax=Lycorma delicatula TaxID=130591 RepID=UPI003F515582
MRILLYVISFFIFSAENVPLKKWPYISTKFNQNEKYPNLQKRCISIENKDGFVDYIKEMYKEIQVPFIKRHKVFKLAKVKNHKYYEKDVIKLTIFEKHQGEKEVKLLSTLYKLLDAIPEKIIIKRGIINTNSTDVTNSNKKTEADSKVSEIDITETISTDDTNTNKQTEAVSKVSEIDITETSVGISSTVLSNVRSPMTSKFGSSEYVIMDGMDVYAYSRGKSWLQDKKNELRNSETEKEIYKKIEIPCTLRLNTRSTANNFFNRLTPYLNVHEEKWLKHNPNIYVQFELQFSYICKFVSPLQVFLNKNILQYKILNFTVSGYQFKKVRLSKSKFFGLTYCLQHQNIDNYEYDLEDDFFYNFKL